MSLYPADSVPNKVLLFSGHMIDAPGREHERFPPEQEPVARLAISESLARLDAGSTDLAICGGACGGDLLFAEAAVQRGTSLEIYLPFEADAFARTSVDFAGGNWRTRFEAVCGTSNLHLMSRERPLKAGEDPYEQVNLWMLEAACRFGSKKVEFICLWNGMDGDGPGGTQHLKQAVERRQGHTHWLDTRQLWK